MPLGPTFSRIPFCVSLTGPDDKVNIEDLHALSLVFPSVEWALLYLPGGEGRPRNPTPAWRKAFFDARVGGTSAVHLCGAAAFEQLRANELPSDVLRTDRLQLNINPRRIDFQDDDILAIFESALGLSHRHGPSLILQLHEGTERAIQAWLPTLDADDRARVHILLDGSKGKGIRPESWTVPEGLEGFSVGFAGGLGPENTAEVLSQLPARTSPFWIDMESGIRTDNEFDLAKARAVLEAAASFAQAQLVR